MHQTFSANRSGTMFDVCNRLVPVLCRCWSYGTAPDSFSCRHEKLSGWVWFGNHRRLHYFLLTTVNDFFPSSFKKSTRCAIGYLKETLPHPLPNLVPRVFSLSNMVAVREKNIYINNKTAKRKATWGFPIFRTDNSSFFRGFNEESESRYDSNIIDDE